MNSRLIFRWRQMILFNHCSKKYHFALWMVLQIVFRTAFSRFPRGLEHFADRNSIPKSLTTIFHPVLTVAILLTYLPLLVERLLQRCHLSRIDEVLKCVDSMIKLHMLSQIPSSCLFSTFGLCDGSKNFKKLFFRLMWRLCFARMRLSPLGGKILCHDSVPVIVSGFTFLIEDPVICRHQITTFCCSWWSFASASPARGFC